ncbi:MAG: transglutaminase family protein [bacterium]|nr:transglutaminase family protein [bacterium]
MLKRSHLRRARGAIAAHHVTVIAMLLIIAPTCRLSAQELAFDPNHMPDGWSIEREIVAPEADLPKFETKFGAKLTKVRNQSMNVRGMHLLVNSITTQSEVDAVRVAQILLGGRDPVFVARKGSTVVEFANMGVLAAQACRNAMGLSQEAATVWQVSFRVACVETLDYMEASRVFNLCLAADRDPQDARAQATIDSLIVDWTFGNSIALRAPGPGFDVEYSIEPAPTEMIEHDGVIRYRFADLPAVHGMPSVFVTATIRVGDRYSPVDGQPGEDAAAPRWQLEDKSAADLARHLASGGKSDRERLGAVLTYVRQRIADGGSVTGSRYGVAQTFLQGYGHCWDKSDALVAMCRAAGLRARETAGWVGTVNSGHVWAEVYLSGEGWLPVDATCSWLGVSADYIPWFATDDGEMPVVYLDLPKVKRM